VVCRFFSYPNSVIDMKFGPHILSAFLIVLFGLGLPDVAVSRSFQFGPFTLNWTDKIKTVFCILKQSQPLI
jgi:hypothetical protein